MIILPLAGYYSFTQQFPLLPSWYTEYYSQEDRLKQVALILQRQTEWTGLAMEKVNEVVEVLNETGQVDVSDFLNQINTVAGNIETIFNELETIEELISEVDGKTTTNTDKVSSLNTQVLAINDKIVQVEELISNNSSTISSVSGRVSTLETNFSDLSTRTASVEGSVSTVNTELESVSQDISNIQDTITNINSSVSDLTIRVDSLENSSGGVDPALEGRVIDLEETVDTHTNDISGLTTRVDTLESSSGGGGGTDVVVEPTEGLSGINIKTGDLDNYLTFNSFDGSLDISSESSPFGNGWNINLEVVDDGTGGGTEIIKQFGTEFSSGKFSLLKDDSLTSYSENFTLDYIGEFGSDNTLYATIDDNKLYIYDTGEWLFPQNVITPEYTGANPMGRYIPIIMDKNIPDGTKVYWDGEKNSEGKKIYKLIVDLSGFIITPEVDKIDVIANDYDRIGAHSVHSIESTVIKTDTPTIYSPSSISFALSGLSLTSEITAIMSVNIETVIANITYGKFIVSFTK